MSSDPVRVPREPWGLKRISVEAFGVPWSVVVSDAAYDAGVSVVLPVLDADPVVSIDVRDVEAEGIFRRLGDQVGLVAQYSDGVVEFVSSDRAFKAWGVVRSGVADPEPLANALREATGGVVQIVGDRLVVFGADEAVERAEAIGARISSGVDGWAVDVAVVELSETLNRELGLGVNAAFDAQLEATGGVGRLDESGAVFGARARAVVGVVGRAVEDQNGARLLRSAQLFVLEGSEASFQQGSIVRIPRRTVSDQGTVTTTGFETIPTGLRMRVRAKRVEGGALFSLTPSVSAVTGFVDGAPTISESSVESSMVLASGEYVVLSGFDSNAVRLGASGLPGASAGLGRLDTEGVERASIVFLVRAQRVYAGS
jgi:Flp pilus assembly secretin CpaC